MAKRRGSTKGPTMKDLTALAGEMNKVMGLDPVIDPVADELDEAGLIEAIKDEAYDQDDDCQIYTSDKFSKEAWATLKSLGIEAVEPPPEDGATEDPPAEDPPEEEPKLTAAQKKKADAAAKKEADAKKKADAAAKKKAAAEKAAAAKKPAVAKFTRIDASVAVIKGKKAKAVDILTTKADELYESNGGSINEKEARWAMNHTIKVLVAFEAIEVVDGKIELL